MSFHPTNFAIDQAVAFVPVLADNGGAAAVRNVRRPADSVPIADGNSVRRGTRSLSEQIVHILTLSHGWDGPGSVPIQRESVLRAQQAIGLVRSLSPFESAPAVVPCPDGSLQIEWHEKDSRFEMYFEVDGSTSAWLHNRVTGEEIEAEEDAATRLLAGWSVRGQAWPMVSIAA